MNNRHKENFTQIAFAALGLIVVLLGTGCGHEYTPLGKSTHSAVVSPTPTPTLAPSRLIGTVRIPAPPGGPEATVKVILTLNSGPCTDFGDKLDSTEATARLTWAATCFNDPKSAWYPLWTAAHGAATYNGVHMDLYPTFARIDAKGNFYNPLKYFAPKVAKSACNLPEGYVPVYLCAPSNFSDRGVN